MKLLVVSACLVVCLAYVFYCPVPPGLPPVKIRVASAFYKALDIISIALDYVGYNRAVKMRDMMMYMVHLQPRPQDLDIVGQDAVFDGIPVHIFTPKAQHTHRRAVVFYHGGGFFLGDLHMFYDFLLRVAKDLNAVAVYVEYRLAPEHIFPAAVDDCEKATLYFLQHAAEYGVDKNRIALMGDSAGGNLVATVGYRLHQQQHIQQPKLHVLIYPMIESLTFDSPSYRWNEHGPMLLKPMLVYYPLAYLYGYNASKYYNTLLRNEHTSIETKQTYSKTLLNIEYLPKDELTDGYVPNYDHGNAEFWNWAKSKLEDPSFCPLFGKNISGKSFPRTYINTCQYDILRDEGIFYVQHLRSYGVDVTHENIEACVHGWTGLLQEFDIFIEHFNNVMRFVDSAL